MRVNGFRCDVCCKEHLLDLPFFAPGMGDVFPADWYFLTHGPNHGTDQWMFCSTACMAQWAEKQVIAAVPEIAEHANLVVKAPPSSTEVFQGLAERLQKLGEVPHKRLMHGTWLPGDEE